MVNECAGERYAKDVKQSAKKDHHEEDGFETANCRMDHHPSETAWGNLSHPQSISEANASPDSSVKGPVKWSPQQYLVNIDKGPGSFDKSRSSRKKVSMRTTRKTRMIRT